MEYTTAQLMEIDRLVAEHVMGWQPGEPCHGGAPDAEVGEQPISADGWYCYECGYRGSWGAGDYEHERLHPSYTCDRDAAMHVLEKLAENHGRVYLGHDVEDGSEWNCSGVYWTRNLHNYFGDGHANDFHHYKAEADTPMLAICLAALKRAGVEVPA